MSLDNARSAAFAGTGTSEFARAIPGKTRTGLLVDAVTNAIADAGIRKDDVDGIITTFSGDPFSLAETLGIRPTLCLSNENGCGSTGFATDVAEWAVTSGRCKYVVLVCGTKPSGNSLSPRTRSPETLVLPSEHVHDLDPIWGANHLAQFSLVAQRHMHEFGTTAEQLAAVAAAFRYNASLNPEAVYRETITIDDVLSSPMIASPHHRLMCAMVNDGAAAAVLTTLERARDAPNRPVRVVGSATAFAGYTLSKASNADQTKQFDMVRSLGKIAADELFTTTVDRADIAMVQACEHFAIIPILVLEDYGFCAKGEGGSFVGDGASLRVGGELPFSTYGGEMSGSHAGQAHTALVEAIRQLSGKVRDGCSGWEDDQHGFVEDVCRKVEGAELALFASTSGKGTTHSLVVLGTD